VFFTVASAFLAASVWSLLRSARVVASEQQREQNVRMDERNPQQGISMIDLRIMDAALSKNAQRYVDLRPEWSPQLQLRMGYTVEPEAPRLPRIKPD